MMVQPISRTKRLVRIFITLVGVWILLLIGSIIVAAIRAPRRHFRAAITFSIAPSSKSIFATSYERELIKKFPDARLDSYTGKNVIDVVVTSDSPASAQIDCSAAALAFVQEFGNKYSCKVATTSKYGEVVVTFEQHSIIRDEIRPRIERFCNWLSSLWRH